MLDNSLPSLTWLPSTKLVSDSDGDIYTRQRLAIKKSMGMFGLYRAEAIS